MRPLASKSRPAQTLARSRHPKIRNRSQSRTLRPSKQAVDRSVQVCSNLKVGAFPRQVGRMKWPKQS